MQDAMPGWICWGLTILTAVPISRELEREIERLVSAQMAGQVLTARPANAKAYAEWL